MKKLLYFLFVLSFSFFSCNKKDDAENRWENCQEVGTPPAKFIVAIPKTHPHSQDFLDANEEKDASVYFYKLENGKKILQKTSLYIGEHTSGTNFVFIVLDEVYSNFILTGNLETIYLNNKGVADVIQIKTKLMQRDECNFSYSVEELTVNGKKPENLPNLHWRPYIYLIEQ